MYESFTSRAANIGVSNRVGTAIGARLIAWGMRVKAQATPANASQ